MNSPPNTSHIVAEAKPENTTCGGATANSAASAMNISPVMCSGSRWNAHRPMASTTNPAACIVVEERPAGGGAKKMAPATVTTSAARIGAALVIRTGYYIASWN